MDEFLSEQIQSFQMFFAFLFQSDTSTFVTDSTRTYFSRYTYKTSKLILKLYAQSLAKSADSNSNELSRGIHTHPFHQMFAFCSSSRNPIRVFLFGTARQGKDIHNLTLCLCVTLPCFQLYTKLMGHFETSLLFFCNCNILANIF